ncbi:hypothetical protein BDR03DRAFT_975666 [Suillus americanus]|nr:hypothetical protein BDR03DRAFT_975641 [Suillus americanus]KAG2029633.1 hypothetical protein BDR03DRAFT_975666 [Suillus americanus]
MCPVIMSSGRRLCQWRVRTLCASLDCILITWRHTSSACAPSVSFPASSYVVEHHIDRYPLSEGLAFKFLA